MDRQRQAGNTSGSASPTSQELIRRIVENYEDGMPQFRMDEISRLQHYVSRGVYHPITISDFFGTERQCQKERNLNYTWLVTLETLQCAIARVQEVPRPDTALHFYMLARQQGDPASALTNAALGRFRLPLTDDGRQSLIGPRMTIAMFNEARERLHESHFVNTVLQPKVVDVLSSVGRHIDNIVCFELGTFEADEGNPLMMNPMSCPCTSHHIFAIYIRNVLKEKYGTTPTLVFQHFEYTDNTANLLRGQDAVVIRNNTGGFHRITENTLVIWMGRGTTDPTPVKQVIADFPFQRPTPLPLPRAMIWPEEGDRPTTMQDVLRIPDRDVVTDEITLYSTEDTPRTNKLHEGYDKHELPSAPQHDAFFGVPKLAIYTRK
ncbi:hypothetical protein F5Y14DRAFT_462354 [Nemania sp. NC0429]|nr:hypothetical protein F5Y14DRAFT_462354 [Nemania sp. NC0429]